MGINQHDDTLTPQQSAFLKNYLDPKSPTWGNARQSAMKAGYSEEYADTITSQMPAWLAENLGKHQRMLMKAELRLEASLDSDDEKIAQDTAKFIAKTVGKQVYSERSEITGADGGAIIIKEEEKSMIDNALKQIDGRD